jgi:hypothetical protein
MRFSIMLLQRPRGLHGKLQGGDQDLLVAEQLDLVVGGCGNLQDQVRLEHFAGSSTSMAPASL